MSISKTHEKDNTMHTNSRSPTSAEKNDGPASLEDHEFSVGATRAEIEVQDLDLLDHRLDDGDFELLGLSPGAVRLESDRGKLIRDAIVRYRTDAAANGWRARAYDAVDAHRAGAGREAHNLAKRVEYAARIADEEDRAVRSYKRSELPRQEQERLRKQRLRAARTPEQIDADRKRERERKRLARAARSPEQVEADRAADRLRKETNRVLSQLDLLIGAPN